MSARGDLYRQLCEEIAVGWPKPWHNRDIIAAEFRGDDGLTPGQRAALSRLIDLLGDANTEARRDSSMDPDRHHLRSVA